MCQTVDSFEKFLRFLEVDHETVGGVALNQGLHRLWLEIGLTEFVGVSLRNADRALHLAEPVGVNLTCDRRINADSKVFGDLRRSLGRYISQTMFNEIEHIVLECSESGLCCHRKSLKHVQARTVRD